MTDNVQIVCGFIWEFGQDDPEIVAALDALVAELDEARQANDEKRELLTKAALRVSQLEAEWDRLKARLRYEPVEFVGAEDFAIEVIEAHQREIARLREALREIIEEFRMGIRAGEPQRYDERDPVVIIARAALAGVES